MRRNCRGGQTEFREIALAKDHRSCLSQQAYDMRIIGWNPIFEQGASRGRSRSGCVDRIFKGERNSVKRRANFAAFCFGVEDRSLRRRGFGHDSDERIDCRVLRGYSIETGARQGAAGDSSAANRHRRLSQTQLGKIPGRRGAGLFCLQKKTRIQGRKCGKRDLSSVHKVARLSLA